MSLLTLSTKPCCRANVFRPKDVDPKIKSAAAYVAEVEIVAVGIKMRFFQII